VKEEDILDLIRQGENDKLEFKTTSTFEDNEEIAAQLVAFTNRNGGKILFGVKDDGTLEGARIDMDGEALRLSDIARSRCSPKVEFSTSLFAFDDGDVLVVNIPRRKDIPCAVVDRRDYEIKKRTYYTRTVRGKRLVEDEELKWMFKEVGDPTLKHSFPINITYNRQSLDIPPFDAPSGLLHIVPFVNSLKTEDIRCLLEDEPKKMGSFILEIVPFAILKDLAWSFAYSWLIEVTRRKGEKRIYHKRPDVEKKVIRLSDISLPSNSLISTLSFEFEKVMSEVMDTIVVPPETDIQITLENEPTKNIILKIMRTNAFSFEMRFHQSRWNVGLPFAHPLRHKYQRIDKPLEETRRFEEMVATVTLDANFTAKFNFPEVRDPMFSEHYDYGTTILDLIRESWDWEYFIEKLPHGKLYSIEDKIDEILARLAKPKA